MSRVLRALCLVPLLCLVLAACGGKSNTPQDQPAPPPDQKSAPASATAEAQGFLGDETALLQPVPDHKPMMLWRSPDFTPQRYKAILLDPVVVWHITEQSDASGIKPEQLQALAAHFQDVLTKALTDIKFPLTDKPGPGVLRISAAITQVRPSNPVRNTISSVLPIGILISLGEKAAIGRDVNVGSCAVALRFSEADTDKTMGLFTDDRQGAKYSTENFSELGQAQKALDDWAALIQKRILALWGSKPVAQN